MLVSPTLFTNAHGWIGHTRDWANPILIKNQARMRTGGLNRTVLLSWPNVEWVEGVRDWTEADMLVERNRAQGLRMLAVMAGRELPLPHWFPPVPPWAVDRPDRFALYGAHGRELVERYPDVMVEGVNEYDSGGCTPHEAGLLHRALHDAIHAVQPDATVILGSIQSIALTGNGLADLSTMLDSCGIEPDAISLHIYQPTTPLHQITELIHGAYGVLRSKRYLRTRIHSTEFGTGGFSEMPLRERGVNFRASCRAMKAGGIVHAHMHAADDSTEWGLPRPELAAFWNDQMRQLPDINRVLQ